MLFRSYTKIVIGATTASTINQKRKKIESEKLKIYFLFEWREKKIIEKFQFQTEDKKDKEKAGKKRADDQTFSTNFQYWFIFIFEEVDEKHSPWLHIDLSLFTAEESSYFYYPLAFTSTKLSLYSFLYWFHAIAVASSETFFPFRLESFNGNRRLKDTFRRRG